MLATVLFTDIVSSTERAEALGDRAWRELLAGHHRLVRKQLKRHHGHEVDTAGDGFFATFDHPTEAIACALAIADAVARLGLQIRAGLHTGEVEPAGRKVAGIAVHVGARILASAEPGQIVVSSTVRDLASGSGDKFVDIGVRRLKGVEGEWRLFAVQPPPRADIPEPEPGIQPSGRRGAGLAVIIGGVALLVVAAGIAALLLTRGPGLDAATGPNTVRAIGADGQLASGFRVGRGPSAVVASNGEIWVANTDDSTVTRVDTASGETSVLGAGVPTGLAPAGGMIWVLDPFASTLSAVTPQEVRVVETIQIHGRAIAAAGDSVWIADDLQDTVQHVDARARTVVASIEMPPGSGPSAIAADGADVWVVNGLAGTLAHIDAASGDVIAAAIALPGKPAAVAIGDGVAWVISTTDDRMMEVDASSNRVLQTIQICDAPAAVAATPRAVWVSCLGDRTVRRVDPADGHMTTVQLDGVPGGIAVDGDRTWATIRDS
jgi:DNA-binding beta-propeller fold protein YncE